MSRWMGRGRRAEEWGAVVPTGNTSLAAGKEDLGAREG